MRSSIRGYVMTGLLTLAIGVVITIPISYMTTKEVSARVSAKLNEREPLETKAIAAYMAFRNGDATQLGVLEGYAENGLPQSTALLWQAYEDLGQAWERDQLLLASIARMDDPDLLFLFSYASNEEGAEHPTISTLDAVQVEQINRCYQHLNDRYGGRNGKIRNRYAYLTGLKSCARLQWPETNQSL